MWNINITVYSMWASLCPFRLSHAYLCTSFLWSGFYQRNNSQIITDIPLLKRTMTVCNKQRGRYWQKRAYLGSKITTTKKKQYLKCGQMCGLKSWVNYVCLFSNCANPFCLRLSAPEGVPGPYACLVCRPDHTGQDLASLTGTPACARANVCTRRTAPICYDRGAPSDRSPMTPSFCEGTCLFAQVDTCVDCFSYTTEIIDEAYVRIHLPFLWFFFSSSFGAFTRL